MQDQWYQWFYDTLSLIIMISNWIYLKASEPWNKKGNPIIGDTREL